MLAYLSLPQIDLYLHSVERTLEKRIKYFEIFIGFDPIVSRSTTSLGKLIISEFSGGQSHAVETLSFKTFGSVAAVRLLS